MEGNKAFPEGDNEIFKTRNVLENRPYSYSRYWIGTSLQVRLMRGIFSNANDIHLFLMIFPRMSLHCKLVPVQCREYEYGLLRRFKLLNYHSTVNNNGENKMT